MSGGEDEVDDEVDVDADLVRASADLRALRAGLAVGFLPEEEEMVSLPEEPGEGEELEALCVIVSMVLQSGVCVEDLTFHHARRR